ncbi:condensation domain-containing protein [Plantactinospora sp. WMMC1484]|uniref:condensation domain-containing protein n=1 Tax=Plantactinospora sp. WMMC1484 TaxID=3404122 RepID=UPI003BF60ED6
MSPAVTPPVREVAASMSQRLLWMIDHHRAGSGCLNYPLLLAVTGSIDHLPAALDAVVARHEALRTTYQRRKGRLLQLIHPASPVPIVDGGVFSEAALDREIATPIDARRGVLRVTYWRRGTNDHVLCVNTHHLSTDAVSSSVVTSELLRLLDNDTALPRVAWQYRHALEWQRRQRDDAARAYWQAQLAGAAALPLAPGSERGQVVFTMGAGAAQRLRTVAQQARTTLFTVLLSAYQAALATEFGLDDVCVAAPFANRPRPEMMGTIGLFANLVILRQRAARRSLPHLVADATRVVAEAREHQHFAYAQLPAASGLGEAVFQLLPPLPPPVDRGNRRVSVLTPRVASRFPLELTMISQGDKLLGIVQYASGRVDEAAARRLADALTVG